jgi:hypothetical protein
MSQHLTISAGEAADLLAIRELIEAYAHCADRRGGRGFESRRSRLFFEPQPYLVSKRHHWDCVGSGDPSTKLPTSH